MHTHTGPLVSAGRVGSKAHGQQAGLEQDGKAEKEMRRKGLQGQGQSMQDPWTTRNLHPREVPSLAPTWCPGHYNTHRTQAELDWATEWLPEEGSSAFHAAPQACSLAPANPQRITTQPMASTIPLVHTAKKAGSLERQCMG